MRVLYAGLTVIVLLTGCSSPKEENQAASSEQHKELSNAVNQPLEKARGVEQQVLDEAERQKQQAEAL